MYRNSSSSSGSNSGSRFKTGGNFRPRRPGFGQVPTRGFRQPARTRANRFNSESIDISRFVKKASLVEEVKYEPTHTFADFNFCRELKANLDKRAYVNPTPIQDQAIPHVLAGRDLVGLANTGTGKTAAFLLPLIEKIFAKKGERVLIIAPTRELAQQIEEEFRQFSWSMRLFYTTCVGGLPIFRQINDLRRQPHVVIGTPGRLKDLNERGILKLDLFRYVVLDEVDRMLDMGFIDDIKMLLHQLPEQHQTLFFSATMPPRIRDLANLFLKEPVTIEVSSGKTAANVDQDVIRVRDKSGKFNQLSEVLSKPELKKVLIFSETKREVESLTEDLARGGFKAESIHGDKRQHQRQRALRDFRDNRINILVATDVAARGLDIDDVSHVINYTIPHTFDDYIHRIGRTGRGDKKGFALTFV